MNLIDKIKQLRDVTKSPEVKEICENFLSGNSIPVKDHDMLMESVKEMESPAQPQVSSQHDLLSALRQGEIDKSKGFASKLMESWGGLDHSGRAYKQAGVYGSYKDGFDKNKKEDQKPEEVLSLLESHSETDAHVASLLASQKTEDLGLKKTLRVFEGAGISGHPAVKSLMHKYSSLLEQNRLPEYIVLESFVNEFAGFDWDSTVKSELGKIAKTTSSLKNEIEVAKAVYHIKASDPTNFYVKVVESLNSWLISEEKSVGLLTKDLSRWQFNPIVQKLVHTLKINESAGGLHLTKKQGESEVNKIYSPVLTREGRLTFQMSGSIFEASAEGVKRLKSSEIEALPIDYKNLLESFNKEFVKLNETGVNFYISKTAIKLVEAESAPAVFMNGVKLRFNDMNELGRILHLEFSSIPGVNAAAITKDVINVYESFDKIVELDIAKNISSRIYEGLSVNLIKWKNQVYVQRINEGMKEDSFLKTTGTQAMKIVKDLLRFDISEGLSQFLEGENKLRAVMVNDRNKVIENISIVEKEIKKLEALVATNKLYESSPQIKAAYSQLTKELDSLKEKWSAINSEMEKFDNGYQELDMLEEGKYSIGDYVRVKESGDNGKVISIDSSSGSYVVMMNDGKTGEYRVDEIEDMESAISKAKDDNEIAADEDPNYDPMQLDDQPEEVKESQETYAKAPGEAKMAKDDSATEKRAEKLMSDAPKDEEVQDKTSKKDVENQKVAQLADAPEGSEKETKYEASPEIGYNLREGEDISKEDPNLAEAPKSSSQEKSGEEFIENVADQNLAKAPGKEGDIGYSVDKENGYNLDEKAEIAGDPHLAVAPDPKAPDIFGVEKIGDQNLAKAPGKEGDIDYSTDKESGYNLDEKAEIAGDSNMAVAPEAKAGSESAPEKVGDQNLAEAPGKEGDIDYSVDKENGYNLDESDEVKKN